MISAFIRKDRRKPRPARSPAPVRDGGAETVDEQDWRALTPGEVVHAHPLPRPGGAAPAQLLQGQRRHRRRRGGWGRRATGAGAAARGAREDAARRSKAVTAMGGRPRGEAEAAARCWRGGGGGVEAVVVGGKGCHIHPSRFSGCRRCSVFTVAFWARTHEGVSRSQSHSALDIWTLKVLQNLKYLWF
jgi:hypothetical protein